MNKSKIVVIILLIIVLLIHGIGVKNAFINFRSYNKVRKDVKQLNNSLTSIDDRIETSRKKITEAQGDKVNSDDVTSIYNAVKEIGVTSIEAQILSISGEVIKTTSDYTEGQDYTGADGIQIIVTVDNVDDYMNKLNELKLVYLSLNVVYPDKKVVMRFNTKGGV